MQQYTVLVIESTKGSILKAADRLRAEHAELGEPQVVLLTTDPQRYAQYTNRGVTIVESDFTEESIQRALENIDSPVRAVICRGDKYVQYLRKVVPFLPADVPVSSAQALEIATNKRMMRDVFTRMFPEITPGFVRVGSGELANIEDAVRELSFPVMIKPASLASSIMVQKCDDLPALQAALPPAMKLVAEIYTREDRTEQPELIIEEFLEGTFYSMDSYVLKPGEFHHLPPVYYQPAQQLGIDDFFLYKRYTPTDLSVEEVRGAEVAAEKAIQAAGLQYSSVHTELVRTASGWKVIEIGPRIGRFRNVMYRGAYGLDHAYNDVLIHLGLPPETSISMTPKYCAAYSIYPRQEGVLRGLVGVDLVREHLAGVLYEQTMGVVGEEVHYARNGGHALYEVIFVGDTKEQFDRDCAWFEANVYADV